MINDLIPYKFDILLTQDGNHIDIQIRDRGGPDDWYAVGAYSLRDMTLEQMIEQALKDYESLLQEIEDIRDEWNSYPRGEL